MFMGDWYWCRFASVVVSCDVLSGLVCKLALQIIELAPATNRVAYKTGANTRREGKRETVKRENNIQSRGVCLPDDRRN